MTTHSQQVESERYEYTQLRHNPSRDVEKIPISYRQLSFRKSYDVFSMARMLCLEGEPKSILSKSAEMTITGGEAWKNMTCGAGEYVQCSLFR